jgi:biopolymer transport protein ExbD
MARKPGADEDPSEGIGFNMTPMIDVVFQLIIFLMLANDMSRREIEELDLPAARQGQEDLGTERSRVIVNLLRNVGDPGGTPTLLVKGVETDLDGLRHAVACLAAARPGETCVLIRADRASRWQDVQWVMQALAAEGIHRLQFAVHDPGRATGGKE